MSKWPNATLLALNRDISNDNPLILLTINNNFGPTPFRIFNSWFGKLGFEVAVKKGIEKTCESSFKDEIMAIKMKAIREELKLWRKNKKEEEEKELTEAQSKLLVLDDLAENRRLTEEEICLWKECKAVVREWHQTQLLDLQQKARVRWIELGDENTSYFHSVVNNHISRNKVSGLWIGGQWISDPMEIKNQFQKAFKEKFNKPVTSRPRIGADGFSKLSQSQAEGLVVPFSIEEVHTTVWDCGISKAPGPDGITFKLIKTNWEELKGVVMDVMTQFHTHTALYIIHVVLPSLPSSQR
ncbi:uncharacterized protein LOC118483361 [Helianthus annuus]|uniref:uncharacterized protein LOC110880523 n=1 Tax=Helianthus annuus TaxID=4232 RepID=UPI001652EBC4|nr:uncharacterized protein LOC110880523 [Helianthus annuus]XP_035834978.1 uncharacterized protein LOC118483361 [Helianthus annuus]